MCPAAAVSQFTLLVPYVLSIGHETRAPTVDRLTIDVTGHLWWWEASYRRGNQRSSVASWNELRIPAGEPVERKRAAFRSGPSESAASATSAHPTWDVCRWLAAFRHSAANGLACAPVRRVSRWQSRIRRQANDRAAEPNWRPRVRYIPSSCWS